MLVSHSKLQCWRRCPREYYFRYELGRASKVVGKALVIGKRIDEALKAHHLGKPWQLDDPAQRAMMLGYAVRYPDPLGVTAVDVPFTVRIRDVEVNGEIDAVAGHTVIEFKTTSEDIAPGSDYWKRVLSIDPQASTYLHASGYSQLIWDVLRKPELRQKKAESADDFCMRIIDDIAKRPEHYYQRATVVRLEADNRDFVRDVTDTVRLIQLGVYPRNPDSCFKFHRPCDFWPTCGNGVEIINDDYYIQRSHSLRTARAPTKDGNLRRAEDRQVDDRSVDAKGNPYRF